MAVNKKYPFSQMDLERFQPSSWDDIVGNPAIKEYFFDAIYCIRERGDISGFNMIATGPSRDGKTSAITFGMRCMLCCNLDLETMNPCHSCENCTAKFHLFGNDGWNNSVDLYGDPDKNPTPVRFHYFPLDCTQLKEADVESLIAKILVDDGQLKFVYLDEVHRLSKRWMDEKLLKPTEMYPAIWLASSAVVEKEREDDDSKIDKMFQNRFSHKLRTERPNEDEMLSWLVDRCEQFKIKVEDNSTVPLNRLIDRSNRSPGMALQVLNRAHKKRSPLLTLKLVEEHIFDFDD